MYGMSGLAKKLNVQNSENSTGQCTLYVRNPELRKFNGKLCTLYVYRRSGFAEKLNIQNCENSMGNCVQYICTDRKSVV